MAVVSRVATLTITLATGTRTWQATAASQDTAAGSSVVVTVTDTTTGASPPVADTALTLNVYDESAGLVRAFTLTPATASQAVSFFFTSTGASGGAARAGSVELSIRAQQTAGLAATQYDYETNGAHTTLPTGGTASGVDRGWVRGTTTASTVLAGAGTLAFSDTLTATTTLGAAPYVSRTLNVALSPIVATASAASTTVTFTTALGTVDNRFPASSASRTTAVTFPNSTFTSNPWTTAALTETTRTVDPRVTVQHYMQLDSVTVGTPPDGVTDGTHNITSRLTSQEGDVAVRLTNANSAGLNGLTYTHKLSNHANALQVGYNNTGLVTATLGGQAGWGPFSAWASQLSGGAWDDVVTITTGNAVGLELGGTASLTLLAQDSRIGVLIAACPVAATEGRHLEPGDAIKVAVSVYNRDARTRVVPDAPPSLALIRNDRTAGWQYLAADGATWTNWGAGAANAFTTTVESDALSFATTFSTTTGWTSTDLVAVQVSFRVNGTPYGLYVTREIVGTANGHDRYSFDGPGFAGFPTR